MIGFGCGVIFVYSGAYVAPSHRNKVALVLAIIGASLAGASLVIRFEVREIAAVIGSVTACFWIWDNKEDNID